MLKLLDERFKKLPLWCSRPVHKFVSAGMRLTCRPSNSYPCMHVWHGVFPWLSTSTFPVCQVWQYACTYGTVHCPYFQYLVVILHRTRGPYRWQFDRPEAHRQPVGLQGKRPRPCQAHTQGWPRPHPPYWPLQSCLCCPQPVFEPQTPEPLCLHGVH